MKRYSFRLRLVGAALILALSATSSLAFDGELTLGEGLGDEALASPSTVAIDPQLAPVSFDSFDSFSNGEIVGSCQSCGSDVCDCGASSKASKAAAGAFKPLFYNNKFDYLCDPCYDGWHLGDNMKRIGLTDNITVDVGGQYRLRFMNEQNHRGVGLTGVDDDFLLHRTRLFVNTEIGRRVRLYGEYIDAESNYEDFNSRPIEVNRSDVQNLFVDLMLIDGQRGAVWARAGRQELFYGTQRVISPLDWANTRRTFDGYKVFWKGEKWAIDGFYTRPLNHRTKQFDTPDYDREFMGFWGTYSGSKDRTLDLFYLAFNNGDAGYKYDTLGGRLSGKRDNWVWELEGGVQFGDESDWSDHSAGFGVAGLGRKFPCLPWKPALWAYYDWASGSNDLGAGHGYHHMFPLAHKYLGFMDLYGRRNIETPNVKLTMQPTEKIQILMWYYYFFLQNDNDSPYNVNMTAYNGNNAPASSDLGQEIDLTVAYKLSPRTKLLVGYSHFFAGDYYKLTPGVQYTDDANFVYTQFHVNF